MEKQKNTVTLSLEDYNELRDFKKNTENEMVVLSLKTTIWGNELHVKGETEIIKELTKKISELSKDKEDIINSYDEKWKKRLDDRLGKVKEMNLLQFLRWKRKNKKK